MANTVKISAEKWVEAAKAGLIEEGVSGVKVNRLAKRLKVTRGGFYYHFANHQDLVGRLIEYWARSNDFLPEIGRIETAADALRGFDAITSHLILQKEFSPAFEMAVREWGRIDRRIARIIDRVDNDRIARLTRLFLVLGYDDEEAAIRARVYFFHQIGFYSLGYHERQTKKERLRFAPTYMRILCGSRYTETRSAQTAASDEQ